MRGWGISHGVREFFNYTYASDDLQFYFLGGLALAILLLIWWTIDFHWPEV